jgi:tetratricopeptide (TPR) repeat protein
MALSLLLAQSMAGANTNNQGLVTALSMVAKGEYAKALTEFERQGKNLENEMPDIGFYIAECHYKHGDSDLAERMFKQVVASPFNKEEAYGRLLDIAQKRGNSQAVAEYAKAIREIQEKVEREYKGISGRKVFTPDPSETQQEAATKALKFYSSRQGYPEDIETEDLVLLGRYDDVVKVYEYLLHKKVSLSERFISPLARKLYERIAVIYSQQAEALKKKNRPEAEVTHASIMTRYYANKAIAVRSESGTE